MIFSLSTYALCHEDCKWYGTTIAEPTRRMILQHLINEIEALCLVQTVQQVYQQVKLKYFESFSCANCGIMSVN